MMEPMSTITIAVLSLVSHIGKVVSRGKAIMSSREDARSMRRQMRYFDANIKEVDHLIHRVETLIPHNLYEIIWDLTWYCRNRGKKVNNYYYKHQKQRRTRVLNWVYTSVGRNLIANYQTQLDDCEDWLDIALLTSSLWVADETRRNLPENSARDLVEGPHEVRCKHQLRQHLIRTNRSRNQNRYYKMEGAGIDLHGLRRLAENILDDPATDSTGSNASSQGLRNAGLHDEIRRRSNGSQSKRRTSRAHSIHSSSKRYEPVYQRSPRRSEVAEPHPEYDFAAREHQHSSTQHISLRKDEYQHIRYEHQSPTQSRSPTESLSSCVSRADLPVSNMISHSPTTSSQKLYQIRNDRLSSSRSSPISCHANTSYNNECSMTATPRTNDSTTQERFQRRQRSSSINRSHYHSAPNYPQKIDNPSDTEPRPRSRNISSRSSSLSHDSGFCDEMPRLRRSHAIIGRPPLVPMFSEKERARRGSRRSSIASDEGGVRDGLRRAHVIRDSRPPMVNDLELGSARSRGERDGSRGRTEERND